MSACKTGCGREQRGNSHLCPACEDEWADSPEATRYRFNIHNSVAAEVALVDFCARIRAERQNGSPDATR